MKRIVGMILILTLALGLCPVGQAEGHKLLAGYDLSNTTIEFWNCVTGTDNEVLTRWVDKFNAENEYGITIHQDSMDGGMLLEKLPVALNAGNGPQLIIANNSLPAYADKGLILELSEIFEYTDLKREDFIDGLLDITTYEGGLYGLPFYIGVTYMYLNGELYDKAGLDRNKPPKTWDEMWENCKVIKEKLGEGYYGLCFPYGLHYSIMDLMASYGGKVITIDPETNLYKNEVYSEENINALKQYYRFFEAGYNPIVGNDDLFYSGIIASHIAGPWVAAIAEEEYGIDVVFGLAPGTEDATCYFCFCQHMDITNNCKTMEEKLACFAFMAYWNSPEPCIDFSTKISTPIYLKAAMNDERVTSNARLAAMSDFEGRTAWNWIPNGFIYGDDVGNQMISMFEAIAMGGDLEECLKKASDAIDIIVATANEERIAAGKAKAQ